MQQPTVIINDDAEGEDHAFDERPDPPPGMTRSGNWEESGEWDDGNGTWSLEEASAVQAVVQAPAARPRTAIRELYRRNQAVIQTVIHNQEDEQEAVEEGEEGGEGGLEEEAVQLPASFGFGGQEQQQQPQQLQLQQQQEQLHRQRQLQLQSKLESAANGGEYNLLGGLLAPLQSWGHEQVGVWLQSIGLGRYAALFQESGIDGWQLLQLKHAEGLELFGLSNRLHQRKLLREVRLVTVTA